MTINIGDNVLVTTDSWFYAPNGKKYRAVWGELKAIRETESVLGIKTNAKSTNWYAEIGNMVIAGCQVHYIIKTDKYWAHSVVEGDYGGGAYIEYCRQSEIYNANEEYKVPKA